MNSKDDVKCETWFDLMGPDPARPTRLTGDKNNIKKKFPKLELRKQFFSNRVVEDWNMLPSEVKLSKNVKTFKKYIEQNVK